MLSLPLALVTVGSTSLVQILVVLVVVGVCWYLLDTYVPLPAPIKVVIRVVIVLVLCLWLLQAFGVV